MRIHGFVSIVVVLLIGISAAYAAGQNESLANTASPGYGQARGGGGGGTGVGRGAGRGTEVANAGTGRGAAPYAQERQPFRAAEMAALAAIPVGNPTAAEIAAIVNLWEDERFARDLYAHFAEIYRVPVFDNIARSEQTHLDQLQFLIDRYGLTVPNGVRPDLEDLYRVAVGRGAVGVTEALMVAAELEAAGIMELELLSAQTDNEDVSYVVTQLLRGSQGHLLAFQRQVGR